MLCVHWHIQAISEQKEMEHWLSSWLNTLPEMTAPTTYHLHIYEITTLFDWVKINRLRKRDEQPFIIPIIPIHLAFSSPVAVDLKLTSLLIKPVTQHKLLWGAKKLYDAYHAQQIQTLSIKDIGEQFDHQHNTPFQKAFLRRLVKNEIQHVSEIEQANSFITAEAIPNIVLLMQGFVHPDFQIHDARARIMKKLRIEFSELSHITFLHSERYLLLLLRIPKQIPSLKDWTQGLVAITAAIEELKTQGIYIFIGVGKVYQDPTQVYRSYMEARTARRKPAVNHLHLRFYEDLTMNEYIERAIAFIEQNCTEPITAQQVANVIGFSPSHFSRVFKREVGRSFVDYVAITRIIRALPYLRKQYSLDVIADTVGFNTPNYFSMSFKKYVGFSPKVYRNTIEISFK